jgi:hypothetical protein
MAFNFQAEWDSAANNNGATAAEITTICSSAVRLGSGDQGLREALAGDSSNISVVKGIHQERGDSFPHITVDYSGGRWHVNLVATASGGRAGYRVGQCTQWRGS